MKRQLSVFMYCDNIVNIYIIHSQLMYILLSNIGPGDSTLKFILLGF